MSRVVIGGRSIGIDGLEDVFQEVRSEGTGDMRALKDLILKKVKAMNYIPPGAEPTYCEDLYEEYLVFIGELSVYRESKANSRIISNHSVWGE